MEPTTVATGAGFRLDRWLRDHFYAGRIDDWMPMILAIEAEARAAAVAPYVEALRGAIEVLEKTGWPSMDFRAEVFALLSAEWHTPRGDTIEEVVTDATGQVIERYGEALQKLAERPAGEAGT